MTKSFVVLALASLLAGCVVSVDSVVTHAGVTRDPRLVGQWKSADDSDRVVVSAYKDSGYAIAYTASGKTGHFRARLGRLGPRMVLDVWPTPGDSEIPDPYQDLLIPGHYLLVIDIAGDTIRTQGLSSDTLRAALLARRPSLAYSATKERIVLLDTTAALRAKLNAHLARAGALEGPTIWHRVRVRR